jgi:hypothetical protein
MIRKSRFNVLSAALFVLAVNSTVALAKPKWQVLFDGKSTASWRGFRRSDFPSKCWTIENKALRTNAGCPETDRVDIVTKDKYQNFELQLEWRVAPGANSGVIYLVSEDEDQTWKTGPEMQVLDDAKHADGKNTKTSAGALYALIAPSNKTLRPVGQYNKARIKVSNKHVEYWLNGKEILSYELGSEALKSLIAQSKFKDYSRFGTNSEGYVALQFHGDSVWYRKVRIRPLAAK